MFLTGFYLTEVYFGITNLCRNIFLYFLASMPGEIYFVWIYKQIQDNALAKCNFCIWAANFVSSIFQMKKKLLEKDLKNYCKKDFQVKKYWNTCNLGLGSRLPANQKLCWQ